VFSPRVFKLLPPPYYNVYAHPVGALCSVVVKALCYKPAGRGFDSR
jgi:hypothetical protein